MPEQSSIIFYGASWCGDCKRAQHYLDTHTIPYIYINIDEMPQAAEKVIKINNGLRIIPTILFPNGEILAEPTNQELESMIEKNNDLLAKR